MIAQLFYPKELKVVLADLREKKDVNPEAFRVLNWEVYWIFLPCLIAQSLILAAEIIRPAKGIELPIILMVITLGYLPIYLRKKWRVYHASYHFGSHSSGIVKRVIGAAGWTIRFDVIDERTSKNFRICGAEPRTFSFKKPAYRPNVGQGISYYLADNDTYNPVLMIYQYMRQQCLSQSMIEEELKSSAEGAKGSGVGL